MLNMPRHAIAHRSPVETTAHYSTLFSKRIHASGPFGPPAIRCSTGLTAPRRPRLSRQGLGPGVVILMLGWATLALSGISPALAAESGTNQASIIHGLLPTVVNIATAKVEQAPSIAATPMVDAQAPDAGAGPSVKNYVGSGFIIDPSGLIVTNYHVVENAFEIAVTLSDGARLTAKTLSASRLADLALLKVEAGHPLPAAHWGDSDQLHVGDQVFAAGNPFGLGLSVSAGIVSGLNRDIQNSPYDDLIQTDATINHGNSGGPLFDMQGNVVGVNSAIISPTPGSSGLGFAIPSSSAHFVIDRLRTYGWVRPAWIGIKLQQVTPEIAEAIGMGQPKGSIVSWVLADGPASKAGLAIADVVLGYNEIVPTDERALLRDLAQTKVGDSVTLTVQRNGKESKVPVTVEEWPRQGWDALDALVPTQKPKISIPPDLGLSLATLGDDDRAKAGLPADQKGVLVKNVGADSDPARKGIANGDIILRVQDEQVATPADVLSGVAAARSSKRDHMLMLVWPKVRTTPGPKWVALEVGPAGG